MRCRDTFFSRDDRYSLVVEDATGVFSIALPDNTPVVIAAHGWAALTHEIP